MVLNVLIVEESTLFMTRNVQVIQALAKKYGIEANIKTFSSIGILLAEYIESTKVDLALLEVEYEKQSGLEIGRQIMKYQPFASLIFVTLYGHYKEDVSELDPVGYLLKPIALERMEKLFCKVIMQKKGMLASEESNLNFITIWEKRKRVEVKESEILYIKTSQRKLMLKVGTRCIFTNDTLVNMQSQLSDVFIKIARDTIVNKREVKQINGMLIRMSDGEILDISRRCYGEVIKKLHT